MQFQIVSPISTKFQFQFQQNYINFKKKPFTNISAILAKIQVLNNVLVIFTAM